MSSAPWDVLVPAAAWIALLRTFRPHWWGRPRLPAVTRPGPVRLSP